MTPDPIVDEIKRYREQQAAKFNYDLRAIVADARRQVGDRSTGFPPARE